MNIEADYVVVGAGSAGAALASRLSESGRHKVLLLEAGGGEHPFARVPISFAWFMQRPGVNWLYSSEPEEGTNGRRIPVPRGRMLGGSSSINGQAWVRGQAADYDHWAQLGNRGWSHADVLPIFRRMESYAGGDAALRGRGGPVQVTDVSDRGRLYDSFVAAAESAGLARNEDYNGAHQEGVVRTQVNINRGRRMSTAFCYLAPARSRANLRIETGATVQQLLLEGRRCTGLRYRQRGVLHEVRARAEVILSAGAIASPQILELSGIGQAERLQALGIAVHHDLPGVGENLQDHLAGKILWRLKRMGETYNEKAGGLGLLWQGLRYATARAGFFSQPVSPVRGFFRTRPDLDAPDAMFGLQPYLVAPGPKLAKEAGINVTVIQLRPESRGSVHIAAPDADRHPSIRFNFLSDPVDRACAAAGLRFIRRIVEDPALAWLEPQEMAPTAGKVTDDALIACMRASAETAFHPVGTCRMGPDPRAVVDERLRVHGIAGLRVADASIMPRLVSGNTNAPSIMIGEKAADLILQDT